MKAAGTASGARPDILFMHYGMNWIRGSEECLLKIFENLDTARYRPLLVCNQDRLKQESEKLGVKTYRFDIPELMIDGTAIKIDLGHYVHSFFLLNRIVREEGIDLIYSNTGLPCQIGVPLARYHRIPIICHFHHPASKRYYLLWLLNNVDTIIFPSNFVKNHAMGKIRLRNRKTTIYNPVDHRNQFFRTSRDEEARKRLGISANEVVIGQVGSLIHRKGHDILLNAFREISVRYPDIRLLIIGNGPEENRLQNMAREMGISKRVLFLGEVESVAHYMQHVFDINVLCSREEGLGIVLIQASACGLPNVATDCTGIREAVRDGETGYLFGMNDTEMLNRKLAKLIESPELRERMGQKGIEFVFSRFSASRYIESIQREMDSLL